MADYSGYIAGNNVEKRKENALQEMMANFSLAQNASPDTMLGFALGRWLHGLSDKYWAGKRDARLDRERQKYSLQQGLLGDNKGSSVTASRLMPDGTFDSTTAWASPYGAEGYNRQMMKGVIDNSKGSSEWQKGLSNAMELSDMGLLPKSTAAKAIGTAAGAAIPSAFTGALGAGSVPWGKSSALEIGKGISPNSALGTMFGDSSSKGGYNFNLDLDDLWNNQ